MRPERTADAALLEAGPASARAAAETARAKINLALHVTGRRPDGYHTLESLVVFAGFGDRIEAVAHDRLTLDVAGPFAGLLLQDGPGQENLVLAAARALDRAAGRRGRGATLRLDKRLPVASGIGGGSADAAATLRALIRLWDIRLAPQALMAVALALGADVPMCLASEPVRASGIGEVLEPVASLPALPMVLVNPGIGVPTPDVFRRLQSRDGLPLPVLPARLADPAAVAGWLGGTANALQAAAISLAPPIADCIAALHAVPGCLLARMSGSGATCFGLFPDDETARSAAGIIGAGRPDWWVVATRTDGS